MASTLSPGALLDSLSEAAADAALLAEVRAQADLDFDALLRSHLAHQVCACCSRGGAALSGEAKGEIDWTGVVSGGEAVFTRPLALRIGVMCSNPASERSLREFSFGRRSARSSPQFCVVTSHLALTPCFPMHRCNSSGGYCRGPHQRCSRTSLLLARSSCALASTRASHHAASTSAPSSASATRAISLADVISVSTAPVHRR